MTPAGLVAICGVAVLVALVHAWTRGRRARRASRRLRSRLGVGPWTVPPAHEAAGSRPAAGRAMGSTAGSAAGLAPGSTGRSIVARRGRAIAVGCAATAGAVLVASAPGLGAAVAAVALITLLVARATRRRREARRHAARAEAAPVVIDLLSACLLAGLNPYLGLQRVAGRSPEALRDELERAAADLELGRTPAGALRAAAERTGLDELRAAAGALEAAERWGAPPAEALAARAEALRSRARLEADAEAGRAAVRLAFPLVFCFLPAFVLLVVIPTVAGAVRALVP